jgi:hypothetical protein
MLMAAKWKHAATHHAPCVAARFHGIGRDQRRDDHLHTDGNGARIDMGEPNFEWDRIYWPYAMDTLNGARRVKV